MQIPNYIQQQTKLEVLALAGSPDAHLEAMTSLSDVSDMTSSVLDFDEDDDETDIEDATADDDDDVTAKRQRKSPVAMTSSAAASASDVTPVEHVTRMNPERDNYNVDRITFCWKCGVEFESRKLLLRHLRDHNIDLPFKCYLCDASYEARVDCLRHAQRFHAADWSLLRDKNKVDDVDRFAKVAEVQVQETLANLGLSEQNGGTDVSVERTSGLNIDSDYAQRKVFCSFCVKRFWSLQDLRRHMRSHTGAHRDVSTSAFTRTFIPSSCMLLLLLQESDRSSATSATSDSHSSTA